MPSESERDKDRNRQAKTQTDAAGELADRAAESVGRRYDGTKELHLGEEQHDRPDEDAEQAEQKDD